MGRRKTNDTGLPEPCPKCEGPGYLEFLDLARGIKFEACRACGHRWETVFREPAEAPASGLGTRTTRSSLAERLAAARAT